MPWKQPKPDRICHRCRVKRPLSDYTDPQARRCIPCIEAMLEAARCVNCGAKSGLGRSGPRMYCPRPACQWAKQSTAGSSAGTKYAEKVRKRTAKVCPICGIKKPLTDEHWTRHKGASDGREGWCRPCRSAIRRDKAAQERGGAPPERRQPGGPTGPELPVGPLAKAINEWTEKQRDIGYIKNHDGNEATLAKQLGVSARRLHAFRNEQAGVRLSTADRILIGMDKLWWEVWDEDKYPEVAYAFTGEKRPGWNAKPGGKR
jgi:hypothetical protein